ncbi:putative vacuolar protein sorting-associated protein [Heracleum sosnowskyi]|uniref:Vacuolar protein sorting-associated protein n=1 Tax=Heracleum sosnowskyi TaxID=360622 RepID=A0AAD8JCK3_9APIA|nr:putative vacuolar protein sorting-associated protein [Heracleum sosnowskyi]
MAPGTNFASGIIDLGALHVSQITSLTGVWATYEGGPDNKGSTFYEPTSIPEGFFMLGSYGQPNNQPLYGWVLVAKDVSLPAEPQGLALPTDYALVYDSGSEFINQSIVGYIWLPVAPDGYSAVGYIVTASNQKPSVDKVRVVRSVLTEDVENDNWIWGSNGLDIYGSRPVDRGSKALGISLGTFNLHSNGKEMPKLNCLTNLNFSYPSMPNLNQVQALIQAYAPVVYFHPDKNYFPSMVSWFFKNGALLYTKGQESTPVQIAEDGSNLPQNGSDDGAYWMDLPSDKTASDNLKKGDLQSAYSYLHMH